MNRYLKREIIMAVKECGSFDPEKVLSYIEEGLTLIECKIVTNFLTWVHTNGHTFGHNIDEVYARYLNEGKETADV